MIWMHRFRRAITTCLVLIALTPGMNLEAQDPDAISAIEIRGISKVSRETILFRTGFKVGDELKTVDFSKALQVLWEMKAFDDIKINVEDTEQGKKLLLLWLNDLLSKKLIIGEVRKSASPPSKIKLKIRKLTSELMLLTIRI